MNHLIHPPVRFGFFQLHKEYMKLLSPHLIWSALNDFTFSSFHMNGKKIFLHAHYMHFMSPFRSENLIDPIINDSRTSGKNNK